MKIKTLHSFEANSIEEIIWDAPEMTDDQIKIKTLFCGVCRSDIGSYARWEDMPYGGKVGGFGHEGLGEVVAVGSNVTGVKVGDFVSTWSDPAYAEYYYAKQNEFVVVPEASHKYILQPVACAMNILHKTQLFMNSMGYMNEPILLLGSGYMSIIIGQYCKSNDIDLRVVGGSNKDIWKSMGFNLYSIDEVRNSGKRFKVIIDLTSKADMYHVISKDLADIEALICYAATPEKEVHTNFFENCWNCHTLIMPSPRNLDFNEVMEWTRDLIEHGVLNPEMLWSQGYDRNDMNQVKQAFEDGKNRPAAYLRGYLFYEN
jgi:D-arabinose 1-dehydrogenase-like Zn-dependent alcohol dehydrogenase